MTTEQMNKARETAKEICKEIGCSGFSGFDPDFCKNKPHLCSIIRRLVGTEREGEPT